MVEAAGVEPVSLTQINIPQDIRPTWAGVHLRHGIGLCTPLSAKTFNSRNYICVSTVWQVGSSRPPLSLHV